MPGFFEGFCPVGECVVCECLVDKSEAGHCNTCGGPFHRGSCGGWINSENMCDKCKDDMGIDEES